MTAYTMNIEEKAMRELNLDMLDMVSGGSSDDVYRGLVYKRDGVYYINSPILGGEMDLMSYGYLMEWLINSAGEEVAIEFFYLIEPNPQAKEIVKVFGAWGIVDHYQRRVDGKVNKWEI